MPNKIFLDVDPNLKEKNLKFVNNSYDRLENISRSPMDEGKMIQPQAGFCLKTKKENGQKIFVNACFSDSVPAPEGLTEPKLLAALSSPDGEIHFRIPMSIGHLKTEYDKSGAPADVCDIVINTGFMKDVNQNATIRNFFVDTIFTSLSDKHHITCSSEYVILKNRKCIGTLHPHRIRQREIKDAKEKATKPLIQVLGSEDAAAVTTREPKYRLVKKASDSGDGKDVVGEFFMPEVSKIEDISVNVGTNRIVLDVPKHKYFLDINLPMNIIPEKAEAEFFLIKKILVLTMPIKM